LYFCGNSQKYMAEKEGAIIQEIYKRPFIRPLFFWIIGILLQVCFPLQTVSFVLPVIVLVIFIISLFSRAKQRGNFSGFKNPGANVNSSDMIMPDEKLFSGRWVWGAAFACLVVFLAIQTTALTEQRISRGPQESGFLQKKALETQARMVEKLDLLQLPDADKAVLATITVNYRQAMSRELRGWFSSTGVSHILSVSGFHVAIVCAFISMLLSFLPKRGNFSKWVKYAITMGCTWCFTYIAGLDVAAVRAAVMITIFLTGRAISHNPDRFNTFAGAAFCMLVYNPFYLFSIGFQLSYIAVFFLLYLQPRLSNLIEIRNPILAAPWNVLTVTVAAQTGTTLLCFYYFGQSSTVFIFTNLYLSIITTLLIPLTLIWMLVPATLPGIDFLRVAIESMTSSMMWVVERFAEMPWVTLQIRFDFFTLIFSYISLTLFLMYFHSKRYWKLFSAFAAILIILCWHLL
jgi:ComEC/Rec2-related protein